MSQAGIVNIEENNPHIPTEFDADVGFAIPMANILNILGSGSVSTQGAGNTITVHGSSIVWSAISASQTLVINRGYFCIAPGGALLLTLPAVSSVGDTIEISLDGAASFQIIQGAGQQVRIGNVASTAGVGGSITSTQQGDSLRLVCSVANLKWNVVSSMGNPILI